MKLLPSALVAAAFAFFLTSLSARADWHWSNDMAAVEATKEWYVARFSFANSGADSVKVSDLKFSCSCVRYRFDSKPAGRDKDGALTIWIRREGKAATEPEFHVIAFGTASATPKELTIRVDP